MSSAAKAKRAFRLASLVVPSWTAWFVVMTARHPDAAHPDVLLRAVGLALGPLWGSLALVLAFRAAGLAIRRASLAHIDVLTGAGAALSWLSAASLVLAVKVGYASFAVLGLLGTSVFHFAAIAALVVLRGADPMRARTTITRSFSPPQATEGDVVVEEVRFDGTRIPLGFRLFATSRIGPRWPTSRHVLEADESGGEVVVETELGRAFRGEHVAEPMAVWLEDVLGLTRSLRVAAASARVVVLPRVAPVREAVRLLDRGDGPRAPRAAAKLPTEGQFHLREYQQGDDVRRIHWVRSLAAGELVVRLPDELPPDKPRVRLVLDTWFPEAFALDCDAPHELLDALVSAWLATGRALAARGVQVSMVTALPEGDDVVAHKLDLGRRGTAGAARVAARVTWQGRLPVEELLADERTIVVARGVTLGATSAVFPDVRWIIAAPELSEVPWTLPPAFLHAYPAGSTDNRWSRRRQHVAELAKRRFDQGRALLAMRRHLAEPPPGTLVTVPHADGTLDLARLR